MGATRWSGPDAAVAPKAGLLMDGAFALRVHRQLVLLPVPCPGLSGCRLGCRRKFSLARCFDGWLLIEPRTIEGEF